MDSLTIILSGKVNYTLQNRWYRGYNRPMLELSNTGLFLRKEVLQWKRNQLF